MRLLIATPLYPPDSGGPATYAKLLEEHLPREGSDDAVVVVKFGEVRHMPKVIRHVAYFWKVLSAAKKQTVDVVLALDPVSTGLPALLAARIARKPFVVKIVGDFAWEQGTQRFGITDTLDEFVQKSRAPFSVACLRWIQSFVAKGAEHIIVPSEYLKKIVTSHTWGNISPDRISVIYNAIALPAFPKQSLATKSEIITVGRLVPWKGIDGVIDAVTEIRKEIPSATLRVVGDGPERKKFESHGAQQLKDAIAFSGSLTHEETLEAIAAAEIFVLNSTYEGLSHLLIEALMLGKPIIATAAGGNPEVIEDGVTGMLVPVGDTLALSAALERLLGDAELRARLGARAAESSSRFELAILIPKTRALLSSVVSGTHTRKKL